MLVTYLAMRHRPRSSTAFLTPLWFSQPSRSVILRSSTTFAKPSEPTFSVRHLPQLSLSMRSHDTKDDPVTTATRTSPPTSSYTNYGGASSESEESTEARRTDRRILIAGGSLLALFTAGSVAAATGALNADTMVSLAAWFETLGPLAVFLYAGMYFLLELVAVPALPLTLGAGYLFGLIKGTAAVSVAATAAAATSFLIARYGLRGAVANLASRYPRFRAMDRAIGRQGFKFVLLLRLSPLLPFAISNYLYGLTSVNFPEYVVGSWLGMLPGTLAYVSAGAAVSALTDISAGKSEVNPILVLIGVGATIGALTVIGKAAADSVDSVEEDEVVQNN